MKPIGKLPPNILKTAKPGKYSDGGGLYLLVTGRTDKGQAKGSWIYRYTYLKQRYEIGLGSVQSLSLAQARSERDRWREYSTDKRHPMNPIDAKRLLEDEAQAGRGARTLAEVAPIAFEAMKGTLKDGGEAGRWYSPLRLYVLPTLGARKIEDIHQRDIVKALEPIWKTKNPTAVKALNRLGTVMKHGAAMGLEVNLNAVLNARQLLGHPGHRVHNHPSLPWKEIPCLYQSLNPVRTAQRALMYYILTGGGPRMKPLRYAHTSQFQNGIWTVAGDALKSRVGQEADFRIPVTREMQRLIDLSLSESETGHLFPSPRSKPEAPKVISDQAIENIMRNLETEWGWSEPYRPHGLRATFRSWASEIDPSLYAVAETALAHKIGGIVERTYARHDFLDQRRDLMERWADHLMGGTAPADRRNQPVEWSSVGRPGFVRKT
ncbi:tyrosine-type recombinase/integrase [Sedimentitalea arenosa]|uniref:Integrase arm-type DNA-binding domain-containing protein n=1 Tax=Sedimentitalea arenosa TaxID=2798803 RepID=A0A8J7LTH5_9RHOB|nr:integrase arm-type DNA-binding domain-containing protein [Arenibacterium arenosum]MBJ6373134.1 integrase arm-type DNA-binding domain-containing protein [Arenibacterium arenosum]